MCGEKCETLLRAKGFFNNGNNVKNVFSSLRDKEPSPCSSDSAHVENQTEGYLTSD